MEARHSGISVSGATSPGLFRASCPAERSFRVRVGSTLSKLHEQEMGVPQGSITSPALFSIKINNIVKAVLKGTDCSLFVDDFVCEQKDVKQSEESYAAVCKRCSEMGVWEWLQVLHL